MKKKVSVCLSVIMLLSVIFCMSGTKIYDEKLFKAELATSKFFEYEGEGKEKVVYSSYLKGLSGENEFILVESKDNAYAIFTKDTMELIEYSSKEPSPYKNSSSSKNYYAGPGNYFKQERNGITNVHTKQVLTESNRLAIASKVTEKLNVKAVVKESAETTVVGEDLTQENITEIAPIENISELPPVGESAELMSPGITGGGNVNVNQYAVVQKKLIPNYKYFVLCSDHGENQEDECATVATQIMLGYHNWASYGKIITNTAYLRNCSDENYYKPYHEDVINTTDEFYQYLKNIIDLDWEWFFQKGELLFIVKQQIENYFVDNEVDVDADLQYSLFFEQNLITPEIDAGRPVMAGINYFSATGAESKHILMVYGYQTFLINGTNVSGYIAHFGWGSSDTHKWFNSSWLIDCITMNIDHNHSFHLPNNNLGNGHILECDCGVRKATNEHLYSSSVKTPLKYNIENGSNYQHTIFCGCEDYKIAEHIYRHESINAREHKNICNFCEYEEYDNHFFKNNSRCWYCSYTLE